MWSTGGSKKLPAPSSSLVLLLMMLSVSHFWAFSHCRVGAIRVFSPSKETDQAQTMKPNKNQDIFQKYFNRSASDLNTSSRNSTHRDFQESKRTCKYDDIIIALRREISICNLPKFLESVSVENFGLAVKVSVGNSHLAEGSRSLDDILGVQRPTNDHSGLGYHVASPSQEKGSKVSQDKIKDVMSGNPLYRTNELKIQLPVDGFKEFHNFGNVIRSHFSFTTLNATKASESSKADNDASSIGDASSNSTLEDADLDGNSEMTLLDLYSGCGASMQTFESSKVDSDASSLSDDSSNSALEDANVDENFEMTLLDLYSRCEA
ncbi:hypothetical protein RHGRI_033936 [Rhododendron griersonianum]|uniref:Uncharacterized protein n=1 Tax=Rhododendron griersonianum TaxID=479676 RepID=A0AAV6I339_9ERIC|nr:hypothetical protein RHGRI_033936 [Rhododendron griersonianum]